jgi:hypothetical protein
MKYYVLAIAVAVISLNAFAQSKSSAQINCKGYVTKNDNLFEVNSTVTYSTEELAKASGYVFIDTDWNSELHLFISGFIHADKNSDLVGDAVTMLLDLKTTGIAASSKTKPSYRVAQKYTEIISTEFKLKGSWSSEDHKESFEIVKSFDEPEVIINYDINCKITTQIN